LNSWPNAGAVRPPDWPFTTSGSEHKVYLPIVMR
jgi:hypothetical protein